MNAAEKSSANDDSDNESVICLWEGKRDAANRQPSCAAERHLRGALSPKREMLGEERALLQSLLQQPELPSPDPQTEAESAEHPQLRGDLTAEQQQQNSSSLSTSAAAEAAAALHDVHRQTPAVETDAHVTTENFFQWANLLTNITPQDDTHSESSSSQQQQQQQRR